MQMTCYKRDKNLVNGPVNFDVVYLLCKNSSPYLDEQL